MAANPAQTVPPPFEGDAAAQKGEEEYIVKLLEQLIGETAKPGTDLLASSAGGHVPTTPAVVSLAAQKPWWSRFWPDHLQERLNKLFAEHHLGNMVAIRAANGRPQVEIFESMPIYVRIGMHLLFFHKQEWSLLRSETIQNLLKTVSVRQGRIYDDTSDPAAVLEHINSFIQTYAIDTKDLLKPDPASYASFNEFFARKLKPDARPIAQPDNDKVVSSSADCRLIVFDSVEESKELWIKGEKFDIAGLLDDKRLAKDVFTPGSDIVIFRLAPADYHRFHWPVGPAIAGPMKSLEGEYFTVNPQAVNQDFDVFTSNRRDVLMFTWQPEGVQPVPVAYIAVGAMLVGSIGWDNAAQGTAAKRGDAMGAYYYGGSTSIMVIPPSAKIKWDQDLLDNSRRGVETMVRVGDHLGEMIVE